jgi:hypothetical protein
VNVEHQEAGLPVELPNLSGLTLHDLDRLDKSVFASAMQTLLRPDRQDSEAIAGFGSRLKSYKAH